MMASSSRITCAAGSNRGPPRLARGGVGGSPARYFGRLTDVTVSPWQVFSQTGRAPNEKRLIAASIELAEKLGGSASDGGGSEGGRSGGGAAAAALPPELPPERGVSQPRLAKADQGSFSYRSKRMAVSSRAAPGFLAARFVRSMRTLQVGWGGRSRDVPGT